MPTESPRVVERLSARTTHLNLEDKHKTSYCIPTWLRDEQVRINLAKGIPGRIQAATTLTTEPIAVVGFGPSLKHTWELIKPFKYIITCSGAHKFLTDRGLDPATVEKWWHISVDPRDHQIELLGTPHPSVIYLPSSASHPKYLDHLKGYQIQLWHIFSNEEEAIRILPREEWAITGGPDVGTRAMAMARFFGFTNQHIFGIDGSFEATESHAAAHPNPSTKTWPVHLNGKVFLTNPPMLECAKAVHHELDELKDVTPTFYGEGLVQERFKSYVRTPRKAATTVGIIKPALISAEYLQLNEHLHNTNPAYGTSGIKYVDTVKKIAEGIGTTSVLDYGCGKGLLAKQMPYPIWEYDPAIPGKTELPRPADLVVCTDVLEHIEPNCLAFVLDDLRRCTKKVGYFVIHTGPSQKTLADGRNAHLIQKPRTWWEKHLAKFFDVAKVSETEAWLHVVVGPKTPEGQKDLIPVTHDGTTAVFYAPNDTTRWRAKTLFTKEPITIQWIDTMQAGDVLWDVGANVGGYSVWASARRGVKIYAFEPEAANYAVLCRNLRENKVNGSAYCLAVTDTPKLSTLFCSQPSAGSSCHSFGEAVGPNLEARPGIEQGAVGMTLDYLSGILPCPTHLKIDVDGFEHLVIAGGNALFHNETLRSLLVEVNPDVTAHYGMVQQLVEWGYTYDPDQVALAARKDGPFKGCAEYVFSRISPVERAVLDAIDAAPVIPTPFPHCVVEQVFPPEVYEGLIKALPADDQYQSLEASRGTKGYKERFTHPTPPVLSWMTAGRLRAALDKKFGVQSQRDETLLMRDFTGYKISPHTDTPAKVVTMLTYLSEANHGTSLYTPKQEGYSDPQGLHHDREQFVEASRVSGRGNTAFIFARSNTSFHGTEPYTGSTPRHLLLYDSKGA